MAAELGRLSIGPALCITMQPSDRKMHDKVIKFGNSGPTARLGQSTEIAPIHVFLALQDGSYVDREEYRVTGAIGAA